MRVGSGGGTPYGYPSLGAFGLDTPPPPQRRAPRALPQQGPGFGGGPPNVVMQGGQPTLGAYHTHQYGQLPPGSDPSIVAARQAQIHQQAVAYAKLRLQQMRAIASMLPPQLQQQLAAAQGPNVDAAAAWRAISGAFANTSKQAGFTDPRYYLLRYLPEQMRGQGRSATGGV